MDQLGLHSLWSGGAVMVVYLSGVPIYRIVVLGHWSAGTFLCYIQKQGLSQKMLNVNEFFMKPEVQYEDSRVTGHYHNLAARTHILS